MLLPTLADRADRVALRFESGSLTYAELAEAAGGTAAALAGAGRVAVWATPTAHTCVAVVGALAAGVPVVPINPKTGERELAHIVADSAPDLVLAEADVELPPALAGLPRVVAGPGPGALPEEPDPESPAVVVYTSGTTGPPKGVLLPRRAIATNLDALADAWDWTAEDTVVHALPLFHVHGLILGVLGPLRRGGTVWHLGRFDPAAVAAALAGSATVMFGVPTMYHRLAAECAVNADVARGVAQARLLVSGSAALPVVDHTSITATTGHRVVERYGMTETLMNCAVHSSAEPRPGTVGPAVDGVSVRLVDEAGAPVADGEIGEIEVRGPNLFLGYLNRPEATAEAFRDGWFRTGDVATRSADGWVRIVGRRATDLIKSGGYKIGAGEIENALLEHPDVVEAAVTGEPDDDLGERIVAWVVTGKRRPSEQDLADHVARLLSPHKRPRVVHYLDALPRNELGKITKRALGA
ncbi:acyl-CoA synthetase [Actinokineospora globicatena]|uniref:acyl-CoA synthetase n=1 Tax=Actinokineospora globicatena TaxID=103729 RepID=UPI0020A35586|nr:acyl-CoA synthetase [Actinokineospora globicatena]MCP2301897.1 malonyl-CoA/methylmalonyl-CoA synthetase [Actinokineospora globicatena]GLW76444.1 fatty-acyl-CoA synthase [Actinokineospora globicatena]GLW83279.1 fatty-acyl-CoA synthase [Actinokineospora globicatena]